jgi:hypothetical protein
MIIAIDPGPHTGIAIWYPDRQLPSTNPSNFDFETLDLRQVPEPHAALYDYLAKRVFLGDLLIYERFEYQKEKAEQREHLDFTAAEYVGAIKLWHQLRPTGRRCEIVSQSPSVAVGNQRRAEKGQDDGIFWDDEKLRKLGLYKLTRSNHERSALRHLLYYVTFSALPRNMNFLLLLK